MWNFWSRLCGTPGARLRVIQLDGDLIPLANVAAQGIFVVPVSALRVDKWK